MHASKSSSVSLRSDRFELFLVTIALALLITVAATWLFRRGYILYYGDAQSHLNLSRSIFDSRTPGYDQLGTVWLPVLHALCLPFVANDWLWSTGLAGTIPVAACFVFAGTCFFYAARKAYRDRAAAWVVMACFALNPNLLYLGSIPMTEVVFFAGLGGFLVSFVRFREKQLWRYVVGAIVASWAMSLTRYDGWFLIPFAGVWFALAAIQGDLRRKPIAVFIVLIAGAVLAPSYWMAHNWYLTGNPLDFFNGPYSAKAIQGNQSYPGLHNWGLSILYYLEAGQLCAGLPLLLLGAVGAVCAVRNSSFSVAGFLCLTPLFYMWSLHSSGTPIFVPTLYPFSYYNTRYGIAMMALAAFAAGAIVLILPQSWKRFAFLIPIVAVIPWIVHLSPRTWICWKESEVNSVARRAWTERGAEYFESHYTPGTGVLTESASGDLAGIFCRAQIPLREALVMGNGAAWEAAISRPDLVHNESWALALQGDDVARALGKSRSGAEPVFRIQVPQAPLVTIYDTVN